jgi:rod shape determining protein RodA
MAVATASARGAGASIRRDPAAPWRHVDVVLVFSVLASAGFGLLMIHPATKSDASGAGTFVEKQAMFCMIGFVAMLIAAVVDYRVIRDFAPVLYGGTILVLLAVKSPLGSTSKGAQAWFDVGPFQLQPSEFAKLVLIVTVAAYVAAHRGELDLRRLGIALAIAALPMGLIYLQPDLGTALVFVAVLMGMLLVGGARPRHLVALTLVGVVAVVAVINLGVLKQYQLDRLGAFIKPDADTQRSAYNLNQSKIAIGSGGLAGKGLGKGPQTNLSYVPEQHTDFIFTVVG